MAIDEAPDIRTEFLGPNDDEDPAAWDEYVRTGALLNAPGMNVSRNALTRERLDELKARGVSVAVWTANDPADMKRFAEWGVDGIITDVPATCLEVLSDSGNANGS